MTTKSMLPWPKEKPEHLGLANSAYWEQYERQRAEAALSRLRIAVEALKDMRSDIAYDSDCVSVLEDKINETLAEIGEIPQS